MKKLNNKGLTLVEILVSFSIAAIVVISMFNVVMNYQQEASMESVKSEIVSYKNTITKTIQTDIIKGNLRSVHLDVSNQNDITTYTMKMRFNKSVNYSGRGSAVYYKTLKVIASNTKENYIEYDDVNVNGELQTVRYSLLDLAKGCLTSRSNSSCTNLQNILKFASISTNVNAATSSDTTLNSNNNAPLNPDGTIGDNIARFFKLDIAISHPELGGDYHIYIAAPLNYPYCKATDNA